MAFIFHSFIYRHFLMTRVPGLFPMSSEFSVMCLSNSKLGRSQRWLMQYKLSLYKLRNKDPQNQCELFFKGIKLGETARQQNHWHTFVAVMPIICCCLPKSMPTSRQSATGAVGLDMRLALGNQTMEIWHIKRLRKNCSLEVEGFPGLSW